MEAHDGHDYKCDNYHDYRSHDHQPTRTAEQSDPPKGAGVSHLSESRAEACIRVVRCGPPMLIDCSDAARHTLRDAHGRPVARSGTAACRTVFSHRTNACIYLRMPGFPTIASTH